MDNRNSQDIILGLDNTATFLINLIGDITGQTYLGNFVVKCFLSPLEQLAAGKDYRSLLGSDMNNTTEEERFMAFALSQLKVRIVKSPPFWKADAIFEGGQIPDLNLLSSVLKKSIDAQAVYLESSKKKRDESLALAAKSAESIQKRMEQVVENPE